MAQPGYAELEGTSPEAIGVLGMLVRTKQEVRAEFIAAYIAESIKIHGEEIEYLARIEASQFIETVPVPVLGMVVHTLMERIPHYRRRFSEALKPEVFPVYVDEPTPMLA